jgi:NAD(P)-dependent dehydrogenase (short-subunit alcohol dehydrogenase family)
MEKTWLITGCSAGLDRALAESVAARGDPPVATARELDAFRADIAAWRHVSIETDFAQARRGSFMTCSWPVQGVSRGTPEVPATDGWR